MKVLVLNGPNLNMLGKREPQIYGFKTLLDIEVDLAAQAQLLGCDIEFFQSNYEGALIERIHQAFASDIQYIIINPAALTHTSVALRDALLSVNLPFIEVHLSNVHAREEFRKHSYLSDIAQGVIGGFGADSYRFALDFAVSQIKKGKNNGN